MNSSQSRNYRKTPIISLDELILMPEYDIEKRIRNAKNSLSYKPDKQSKYTQIELCYLQRELEIRVARKNAHEIYMKNLRNNRR